MYPYSGHPGESFCSYLRIEETRHGETTSRQTFSQQGVHFFYHPHASPAISTQPSINWHPSVSLLDPDPPPSQWQHASHAVAPPVPVMRENESEYGPRYSKKEQAKDLWVVPVVEPKLGQPGLSLVLQNQTSCQHLRIILKYNITPKNVSLTSYCAIIRREWMERRIYTSEPVI